ncbi:DUF6444 domain-containing protein [Archangium sp.]|uniref:DUF6444 domain-containing protein n=1 Tax=Archangium sp. TaxID=1872627 RepID=UPI0039C8559D
MGEVDPRDTRIAELQARLAEAHATIAELRARLGSNLSNSDKPPYTDGRGSRRGRDKRKSTGRKPGGQVGHEAHLRELLPTQKVDEVKPVLPSAYSGCGGPVEAREKGPPASRHRCGRCPR